MQYNIEDGNTAACQKQNILNFTCITVNLLGLGSPLFSIFPVPVLVALLDVLLLVPLHGHLADLLTQSAQVVLQGDVLQQCVLQYCLEIKLPVKRGRHLFL